MEIITGLRGGGVKITDIKAVQAGFLLPPQDTLIVYLSYSEKGSPDFIFAVALPLAASLELLRRYGKDHLVVAVLGQAGDVLDELAKLDTPGKEKLRQMQERQEELDSLVGEIREALE